jgi:hypothetical protein
VLVQELRAHLLRTVGVERLYPTFAEMLLQVPDWQDCFDVDIGKAELTDLGLIRIFEAAGIFRPPASKKRHADLLLELQRHVKGQPMSDTDVLSVLPQSVRSKICFHLYR